MYCSSCGIELSDASRFCPQCGTATSSNSFTASRGPARPLTRLRDDRKIAGVCSGIARYLGIDVTLVRIITLVLAICPPGAGLIFYVVCWIVMPQEPLLLAPSASSAQNPEPGNVAVL